VVYIRCRQRDNLARLRRHPVESTAIPGNEFITPKSGDRFVAVQVLYENVGSDPYAYNPFDWKLTDSSGDIPPDTVSTRLE